MKNVLNFQVDVDPRGGSRPLDVECRRTEAGTWIVRFWPDGKPESRDQLNVGSELWPTAPTARDVHTLLYGRLCGHFNGYAEGEKSGFEKHKTKVREAAAVIRDILGPYAP